MATFYVGQRVRIKWSRGWPEIAGQEGRIVSISPDCGIDGTSEWLVAPNIWGTAYAPRLGSHGADRFAPNTAQLEPILPEGHKASEYTYTELMDRLRSGVVA